MQTPLTDKYADQLVKEWQRFFPDAAVLVYPSKGNGVATITHTMGDGKLLKINGLTSRSPLANNALFTTEISGGKYLNLYEIMIPDVPGKDGSPSTAQQYVNNLRDNGLDVAGVHFHWFGATVQPNDKGLLQFTIRKLEWIR